VSPAHIDAPCVPNVMMGGMQISAKADYAVRAMLELAAHGPELVKAELLISHQRLPRKFVETILAELRRAGLVHSHRGADGGYELASKPSKVTIGSIIRAVDGPLAEVRGLRPNETSYEGAAKHLPDVWVAVRASLRRVLDETTLAQVLDGSLPRHVQRMIETPDAWLPR
jgi:Rrf2 family protein